MTSTCDQLSIDLLCWTHTHTRHDTTCMTSVQCLLFFFQRKFSLSFFYFVFVLHTHTHFTTRSNDFPMNRFGNTRHNKAPWYDSVPIIGIMCPTIFFFYVILIKRHIIDRNYSVWTHQNLTVLFCLYFFP